MGVRRAYSELKVTNHRVTKMWIDVTVVFGEELRASTVRARVADDDDQVLLDQFVSECAEAMSSKHTLGRVKEMLE